jgi:hypothetical protein
MNINELEVGDIFSEVAHYTLSAKGKDSMTFKHHGTDKDVTLNNNYISNLLKSAQSYTKTVIVGLEDKLWTKAKIDAAAKKGQDMTNINVGDLQTVGIRTVWEGIHSSQVFSVGYYKKDTDKPKKQYAQELKDQAAMLAQKIQDTATAKKGVVNAAISVIEELQKNPVSPIIKGELRKLRGYKIQFTSRDGGYDCVDMDLTPQSNGGNVRPVNINTIQFIIFDDVLYVLEGFDMDAYMKGQ